MISARIDNRTRRAVYARDHYRCALCDSPRYIQIHHAIPKGQGGSVDSMHNLITLCQSCHAVVHGLDLGDAYWGQADVALACVEYLADYYAPAWWPYRDGG